jgi:hypothetical protein
MLNPHYDTFASVDTEIGLLQARIDTFKDEAAHLRADLHALRE